VPVKDPCAASGGPVTVRMFGSLHTLRIDRGLPTTVDLEVPDEGMPAREIAAALELPREMIEGVFCNGHVFGLSRLIVPGDRIGFVPHGTPGPHRFMLGLWKAGKEDEETDS
jgi:hypothetical protein